MTHDYKSALDELNMIFYYDYPAWISSFNEPKLSDKSMYAIRAALQLAQEAEHMRKRLAELETLLAQANSTRQKWRVFFTD